jgi:hypothetical protein
MASILVYLQRSPRGLHPASSVAACLARDLASSRGAAVLGVCAGDGGAFDGHVVDAAARAGCDQVLFVGPTGLRSLGERLQPRHLLVPWTSEGTAAVESAGLPAPEPRWVGGPATDEADLAPVEAIVAGALPWHAMPGPIETEFEGQVDKASLPEWVAASGGQVQHDGAMYFVAPQDLDPAVRGDLDALGARAVGPDFAGEHRSGTLLWLDAGPGGLPSVLAQRPATGCVIALPGPTTGIHRSWALADWVLVGPWDQAARRLHDEPWRAALR